MALLLCKLQLFAQLLECNFPEVRITEINALSCFERINNILHNWN